MKLIRANVNDCEKIWKMQTEAFSDLLERYQDYETSPGNEAKERIEAKLSQEFTYFYYIFDGDNLGIPLIIAPKPSTSSPLTKISRKSAIQAHCLHAK